MGHEGREDVEEVKDVKEIEEVEDRNPDPAVVVFCGRWLTISGFPTPFFAELLNPIRLKSIVFIGLRKCSF